MSRSDRSTAPGALRRCGPSLVSGDLGGPLTRGILWLRFVSWLAPLAFPLKSLILMVVALLAAHASDGAGSPPENLSQRFLESEVRKV
jgi:hypothetical protein